MKIGIVYHRIDCDGLCSFAVLYKGLISKPSKPSIYPNAVITGIGYNHGDALPDLSGYDIVYVADIALPIDVMRRLNEEGRLIWIDHHATAIKDSKAYGYSTAPGLRRIGKGACELCWEFMFASEPPLFVKYLSAYDVFNKERFDFENQVLPFQYGVRNRFQLNPKSFIKALGIGNEFGYVGKLIDEGRTILNYIRQKGYRAAKNYGFAITLAGKVPALCILTDQSESIPYHQAAIEAGCQVIICANRIGDSLYKISSYAAEGDAPIHLGDYLKDMYGGGGHANAAGAVLNGEQFRRLLDECIL